MDVRLIAATHKNLEQMVKEKHSAKILLQIECRTNQNTALRERMEDLPELVDFMLQRLNKEKGTGPQKYPKRPWTCWSLSMAWKCAENWKMFYILLLLFPKVKEFSAKISRLIYPQFDNENLANQIPRFPHLKLKT